MKKEEMAMLAELIASSVVAALDKRDESNSKIGISPKEKSAYAKTETLLYNYNSFKKIVADRMQEIEDIQKYGVPKRGSAVVQYGSGSNVVRGLVLPEESVEGAVQSVEASVQTTVQAIALIDKCMAELKDDMYYDILPMRYFEGRTLEDIGAHLNCDHSTISRNKNRLVRELAMRIFPNDVVSEIMK
jgi:DNA-directed RNA polymerase specialized sigma subunit